MKSNNDIKLNEITINYKINKEDKKLKLFGRIFIENNKNNCYIIIENKKMEICEYLNIDENLKNKEILKIKLIETKKITNMKYLFGRYYQEEKWTSSLISVPDISEWDTKNVIDISGIFAFCSSITKLPDISKWNTDNVSDMSYLFNFCKSLIILPDISKWNTSRIVKMHNMFNHCSSLSYLPDISKWDITKVIDMSFMFSCCYSLSVIPNISNWNMENKIINHLFFKCYSLSFIPNNIVKIKNKKFAFQDCFNILNIGI